MTPKKIPLAQLQHHWQIYLFALPAVVLIGLFQYYPASSGIFHSFFRWNGADIREYIGFENYQKLLVNPEFWQSFRVVLIIGMWNIVKMLPAIAVAVCIHRCRSERLQFMYRLLFVAPMVIPGLVIVLIWRSFFFEAVNGYLNRFLFSTHFYSVLVWLDANVLQMDVFKAGIKPAWLGDGRLLLTACIIWGFPWVGSFAVLTHLAKLQGISKDLYEAADLDGVSWFSKFSRIELPLIMSGIGLQLVFVVIGTIKDAGTILALAGIEGGPGGVVTVPALFMLRKGFYEQQMGAACAVGIALTVVVVLLQKLLGGLAQWESLTELQKWMMRLSGLLLSAAVYFFVQSPTIAVVVLVSSIPWPLLIGFLLAPFRRESSAPYQSALSSDYRPPSKFNEYMLRFCKHGWIWLVLLFAYLPMYLMLIVSVKDNNQFYEAPARVTTPMHWANWKLAWDAVIPSLANSIFITTSSTALLLVTALAAAYFFARVKVPGSNLLWNLLVILISLPEIANLIPLFRLLIDMNLVNTLTALVVVGAAGGQVFAIMWLRNFIADIPQDLIEAAEIDGAGHFRQMFTVVLPLTGPILGVIGVMHAINQWNDFVLPLIVMRDQSRLPVMVQLLRMAGEYIKLWGPLMAGYAMASIPVILLFAACMRLFTRGLTEGAVKA